jgi:hypothetical protein
MRILSLMLLACLVVWAGCGGGGVQATSEKVTLAYGDAGGSSLRYKLSTNMNVNMGGTVRASMMEIQTAVEVDSMHADGTIDRRIDFVEFVMAEISGSRLEYDTDAERYEGEELWIRLGPEGELIDWKGLDGIRAYTNADRSLKDGLVQMMTQYYQPLAEGEVGVGDTWQRTIEIPTKIRGGELNQTITVDYELTGFGKRKGRQCAKMKTGVRMVGEGEGERGGGRKFWVESSGEGGGEFWFDYVGGVPVEGRSKITLTTDISYEMASESDVKTEFITMDLESKVELVE